MRIAYDVALVRQPGDSPVADASPQLRLEVDALFSLVELVTQLSDLGGDAADPVDPVDDSVLLHEPRAVGHHGRY